MSTAIELEPTEPTTEFDNPYLEYERRKTELSHGLTEVEYERACQQIANELGI